MSVPPEFLDEIRARLALSSIVGRKVKLTKHGREHKGLCPFHNEKTPSFTVSDDKAFYHCFGCGAHGDVIGFVMQTEGIPFPEAVEQLASQCGLAMPVRSAEARVASARRAGILEALEAAAGWYQKRLAGRDGAAACGYLRGRGLDDATIDAFRLGYAPEHRDALKMRLTRAGFDESVLIEAGLIRQPDDGRPTHDFLRGRITFPICDGRDRVIGFGGRALGDGQPKYLNSPDTLAFHKGRALYNLARARRDAAKAGTVIVAEGYMDVIALCRGGFEHAVAPLGTAVTEDQLRLLWRMAPEPVLCLDGDAAGRRAAARAATRALPLLAPGQSLRVAFLPAGEDPDSLIAAGAAKSLAALIDAAQPLAAFLWERACAEVPLDTPERRAGFRQRLDQIAGRIADRGVRDAYRNYFGERFAAAFPQPGLRARAAGSGVPGRPSTWTPAGHGRSWPADSAGAGLLRGHTLGHDSVGQWLHLERYIIENAIENPSVLERGEDAFAALSLQNAVYEQLRISILDIYATDPHIDGDGMKRRLAAAGHADAVSALRRAPAGPGFSVRRVWREDDAIRERESWLEAVERHQQQAKAVAAGAVVNGAWKR